MTRDELIEVGMNVLQGMLKTERRKFNKSDDEIDELRSIGNIAIMSKVDVDGIDYERWEGFVANAIRWAWTNEHTSATRQKRGGGGKTASIDTEDSYPILDTKATDPAEIAEMRDDMRQRTKSIVLPSPTAVAARAALLHEAMMDAVSADDMRDVMKGVVARAKQGVAKDVKILIDTVSMTTAPVKIVSTHYHLDGKDVE